MTIAPSRTAFHLVRGPGQDENFDRIDQLAVRVHELRGRRQLHLKSQRLGYSEIAGDQAVDCVTLRAGDDREELVGYALFPDHPAYHGQGAQLRLVKALLDGKPELERRSDGENLQFDGEAA